MGCLCSAGFDRVTGKVGRFGYVSDRAGDRAHQAADQGRGPSARGAAAFGAGSGRRTGPVPEPAEGGRPVAHHHTCPGGAQGRRHLRHEPQAGAVAGGGRPRRRDDAGRRPAGDHRGAAPVGAGRDRPRGHAHLRRPAPEGRTPPQRDDRRTGRRRGAQPP